MLLLGVNSERVGEKSFWTRSLAFCRLENSSKQIPSSWKQSLVSAAEGQDAFLYFVFIQCFFFLNYYIYLIIWFSFHLFFQIWVTFFDKGISSIQQPFKNSAFVFFSNISSAMCGQKLTADAWQQLWHCQMKWPVV